MSSTYTLISFDLCPYVERSRVVLHEKGQAFEQVFIDLKNKPDWFLKLSPRGKVPVLVADEVPIFESSVINEFLDEVLPEPALLPQGAVERARARAWIAFANDVLMEGLATLWFAGGDPLRVEQGRATVRSALERIEGALRERGEGPYFAGASFGLVDATLAPVFTRWASMEAMGWGDLLDGLEQAQAYSQALLARESVQAARAEGLTEKMVELLRGE
ncbi:glutathione S-transferase family protein [Lujinxingia vulgaris]|nr:glutathione S-transferase family protein [Lujinxingia vulgaris]